MTRRRAAGKDVLVEWNDAVSQLGECLAQQDIVIERIVARLGLMAERSAKMAAQLESLSSQMRSATAQMGLEGARGH